MEVTWPRVIVGIVAVAAVLIARRIRAKTPNLMRDLRFILQLSSIKKTLLAKTNNPKFTAVSFWYERLPLQRQNVAFILIKDDGTHYSLTYDDFEKRSNQVANWAIKQGYTTGDVIASIMPNSPEFVIIWLGLAKVGISTSLVNTNVTGSSLTHALSSCNSKGVILHHSFNQPSTQEGIGKIRTFIAGETWDEMEFSKYEETQPDPKYREPITNRDVLFYIYTSGTTGYPKAARFTHARFYTAANGFSKLLPEHKPPIRIYSPLPLYHSAGCVIALGISWATGSIYLTRRKFSASNFWKDCVQHNVDAVQYIGELCRYLLNTPVSEYETKHKIFVAFGNGLRADVWRNFQARFKVKSILEYYAATEGNATTYNTMNKEGAVGYIPLIAKENYPLRFAKIDAATGEYIRGPDGFLVEAGVGEPGEILGLIENTDPGRVFTGYSDKSASEKKVIKDAFKKGDSYFRSGDLMYMDREGFVYFVDRIGDTYRWKGENVSTNEVADVISRVPGVKEANVYGIALKGYDGRCGMAAIVVDENFDFNKAYSQTTAVLPAYANPFFLRMMKEIDTTATLKHKKVTLVEEGCDPNVIKEPIYFRDDKRKQYVKLDPQMYSQICEGTLKL